MTWDAECQVNMQGSTLFIPSYTEAWTHTKGPKDACSYQENIGKLNC